MSESRQRFRGVPPGFVGAVLGLYIAAAALLPIAHHDIICHFKSSTHCTSCIIGSAGDLAADATAFGKGGLNVAGRTAPEPLERIDSLSLPATSGRAPPPVS